MNYTRRKPYKKIIVLISILIILTILLIIYYLPAPLIETIDTSQNLYIIVTKHFIIDGKVSSEVNQYKLICNSDSYNNLIDYIGKYSYRKKYNSFFDQSHYTPATDITYNLTIFSDGFIGKSLIMWADDRLNTGEYGFTYKIIFNDDDNMNKFVENIIEIIKEDEVLQ